MGHWTIVRRMEIKRQAKALPETEGSADQVYVRAVSKGRKKRSCGQGFAFWVMVSCTVL